MAKKKKKRAQHLNYWSLWIRVKCTRINCPQYIHIHKLALFSILLNPCVKFINLIISSDIDWETRDNWYLRGYDDFIIWYWIKQRSCKWKPSRRHWM